MLPACSYIYFYHMLLRHPFRRLKPQLPEYLIRHAFPVPFPKRIVQFFFRNIMADFFLREIFQVFFPLTLFLLFPGRFHGTGHYLFHGWFLRRLTEAGFRLIKEGQLSRNLIQLLGLTAKAFLVRKTDLLNQVFVVLFQPVQPLLHLADNSIFGLMVHPVELFGSKSLVHTVRLSYGKYTRNRGKKPLRRFGQFVILPPGQTLPAGL